MFEWWSLVGGRHLVPDVAAGMAATVLQVSAQLSIPLLVAAIVDDALVDGDARALGRWTAALAIVAVFLHAGRIGQEVFFRRAGQRALDHVQLGLSRHLLALPVAFFDRHQTGKLHGYLVEDGPQVTRLIEPIGRVALHSGVLLAGLLAVLTARYGALVLLALLLIPLYLILPTLLSRKVREASRDLISARTDVHGSFQEILQGAREIKTFGRESWSLGRSRRVLDRRFRSYGRFNWLSSFQSIGAALYFFIAALVYRFGGERVLEGSLSIGGLVALVSLLGMLESPVGQLANLNGMLQGSRAAMDRLRPVFAEEVEIVAGEDLMIEPEGASIRFEEVTFRYPGKDAPALDGVSFKADSGQRVALVGPSGAGKSTVAQLLLRLYEPQEGRVVVAGADVREWSLAGLRAQVGLVRQDAMLLAGSIRDNIAFGRPDATGDEIEEVARLAGVLEFAAGLPAGLETEIGERGATLSGGQRQRIAIARTILRRPPIIVLDEATSALDGRTEQAVREALEGAFRSSTVLVIAHRLSTVEDADVILVLDRGRLVATGRHLELLKNCDTYRLLHQLGRFPEGDRGRSPKAGNESHPPAETLTVCEVPP